jgi:pimeloyl-ACP methyl ester carboxylesterase
VRYLPKGLPSKTLIIYMHPASTQTIVTVPKSVARRGFHVLAAGSRYTRNDTTLIMEKILRDLRAYVGHARDAWGYEKIVLAGWSGGGSLLTFYQAEAERPTVLKTPAGDPFDSKAFGLMPADGLIFHAAHISRANVLRDFIDPSVIDEANPFVRDSELDLYEPRNPNQPPYSADYISYFRGAQRQRMARRTAWVKETLSQIKNRGRSESDFCFITHRTMADPRFLDPNIDPNDRKVGMSFLGPPEAVNTAPAGLARFSTLKSWLSQWSPEDTNVNAERSVAAISVPLLAIANSADDAVLGPQVETVFNAAKTRIKRLHTIAGANHYYAGQPDQLEAAITHYRRWMEDADLLV